MALRFERRDPRSRIFLSLQMRLGAGNGGLGSVEVGRGSLRCSGDAGGGDRLSCIAHFLHGGSTAAGEANET